MTNRNSVKQDHFTQDEIFKRYGIKKTTYYERLKFLGIKAAKDEESKAYLTLEQVELLDKLESHVKATGKMEGFEFSSEGNEVANQSDTQSTNDVDDNAEEGGKLAVKGSSEIASKQNNSSPQPDSLIDQEIPQTQPDFSDGMGQLFRDAAEIKAQNLATPAMIKMHLVDKMTFNDLPKDLQDRVTEINEAAAPKFDPASIASQMLNEQRKRQEAKLGGN